MNNVPLREHIEALIADLRREMENQMVSRDQAITKAEAASEKRLDAMNEFRSALSDQATEFVRREVFDTAIEDVRKRSESNTERLNKLGGIAAQMAVGYLIAIAAIGVAVFSAIH